MHTPLFRTNATVHGCALHENNIYYYTDQDYFSWFHVMVHNHMVISEAGLVDVTTTYFKSSRLIFL